MHHKDILHHDVTMRGEQEIPVNTWRNKALFWHITRLLTSERGPRYRSRMRFWGPSWMTREINPLCHTTRLKLHPHAVFGPREDEHEAAAPYGKHPFPRCASWRNHGTYLFIHSSDGWTGKWVLLALWSWLFLAACVPSIHPSVLPICLILQKTSHGSPKRRSTMTSWHTTSHHEKTW